MILRSAIVGAGLMGRWHLAAIRRAGGRVVACADPDLARARALASRAGSARTATSLAGILATEAVDVVHICTPLPSHVRLAEEAIAAGSHVIVEKPLAATAEDTRRLLSAAAARQRLLIPVHQFPFQPGLAGVLRTLPGLGQLRLVEFMTCSAGAAGRPEAADRVALEILPHPLSILHRCVPPGLAPATWQVQHPAPGEWHLQTVLAGTVASIHVSMAGRPPCNELRLTGTHGRAFVDLFHGTAFREEGTLGRGYKVARPLLLGISGMTTVLVNLARRTLQGEYAYPGLRELVAASYATIRTGGPSPVSPGEALLVAESIDQIRARGESPPS